MEKIQAAKLKKEAEAEAARVATAAEAAKRAAAAEAARRAAAASYVPNVDVNPRPKPRKSIQEQLAEEQARTEALRRSSRDA